MIRPFLPISLNSPKSFNNDFDDTLAGLFWRVVAAKIFKDGWFSE